MVAPPFRPRRSRARIDCYTLCARPQETRYKKTQQNKEAATRRRRIEQRGVVVPSQSGQKSAGSTPEGWMMVLNYSSSIALGVTMNTLKYV